MLQPIKPNSAFDFNAAAGGVFMTSGGKAFVLRLWFWMSAALSVGFIISMPLLLRHYGAILEFNWLNVKSVFGGGPPPEPEMMLSAFGKILPGYALFMAAMWGVSAAGETAFYKKYFHGSEAPRQPLRFGRAELRTMLVQLGVWATVLGVYFFGAMAVGIVAIILGFISPILAGIAVFIGIFAILALLIAIPIRLAPAAALSVYRDKTHVFAANKVTKFRFWNLFIAYLVTYIGGYIAVYIIYFIAIIIATGDPGFLTALSGLGEENPRILFEAASERFKNPVFMFLGIIAMIIIASAMAAWMLLVAGVNAYAVRWWHDDNPGPNFE